MFRASSDEAPQATHAKNDGHSQQASMYKPIANLVVAILFVSGSLTAICVLYYANEARITPVLLPATISADFITCLSRIHHFALRNLRIKLTIPDIRASLCCVKPTSPRVWLLGVLPEKHIATQDAPKWRCGGSLPASTCFNVQFLASQRDMRQRRARQCMTRCKSQKLALRELFAPSGR